MVMKKYCFLDIMLRGTTSQRDTTIKNHSYSYLMMLNAFSVQLTEIIDISYSILLQYFVCVQLILSSAQVCSLECKHHMYLYHEQNLYSRLDNMRFFA